MFTPAPHKRLQYPTASSRAVFATVVHVLIQMKKMYSPIENLKVTATPPGGQTESFVLSETSETCEFQHVFSFLQGLLWRL